MKKVLSLLMSIIMLLSITSGINLSAYASNQDVPFVGIDVYKAQCLLGIAEDSKSKAVDACHLLYGYYVNDDIYSPSTQYLDLCAILMKILCSVITSGRHIR